MDLLVEWKGAAVILWLGAFVILERLFPASPWKRRDPGGGFTPAGHYRQNIALWLINALLYPLLLIGITGKAAEYGIPPRPAWLTGIPVLVADLVVLDLWIYWWHRANHRFAFLWRFHRVHHFDEQLDASTAMRFHFGEVVLSALARAPVILLFSIPLSSVILFETLLATATIFHHSNLRLPDTLERTLSRLIVTPAIHWVHHHALREDTDSNYGSCLSLWDRWFRSLSPHCRTPGMALGIEGCRENRVWRLVAVPFRDRGTI